uniref:hypothetical protein n=1 Tax=Faecousia sp. TaxID=2952921 RepID=UPI0040277A8C
MKTLSKKLLSLLLVAVMLVAAMPFAAFADGGKKTNVTVVGLSNGAVIYKTTLETMSEDFNTANKEHLNNAFAYGTPGVTVDTDKYTIVSGEYDADANQLTVILEAKAAPAPTPATYTVKITGDASATGSKQIDAPAEADFETNYGAVVAALNNAGLGDYTNADNWTITKIEKDDTAHVIIVTVEKKVAPTTPSTEPAKETTYTVTVTVDGKAVANGTSLVVKEGSAVKVDDAQSVLNALNLAYTYADYNTKSFDRNGTTITIAMADKKSTTPTAKTVNITLVSGNSTTTQTVEVGKYYSDYAAFNPAAQDGRTPESLKIESNNGDTRFVNVNTKTDNGKVRSTDTKVTIQWKAADRQIRFYTDSTLGKIYKTLTVYSGKAIGELPTNVNGKTVEYWTVWGSRIYTTTTYDWTADYVDAVPHFAGETGKVYLEIYVNGNRTSKYAQVDITHKLQDGVIYRDTLLDTIRSATKNNSLKLSSVSYLFNESEWSQYVRNVNNTTTNTKLQIGTDSQNARYVYVMVNGVTTKTTDPSNPKTGDSAKLGVAAAVLAVAVVGFGAVIVINKKKGAI